MPRKGESITLSCSPQAKAGLEAIAKKLGYTWGDKPNISALVEAIGLGSVSVVNEANVKTRIAALKKDPKVQEFIRLIKEVEEA